MLLGAPAMVPFVSDRCDDRRLAIVPTDGADLGEGPQPRTRPVGPDQKARARTGRALHIRLERIASGCEAGDERPSVFDAELLAQAEQAGDDIVVHRHMGERLTADFIKAHLDRAHRVAHAAVHNRHSQDRFGKRGDRLPRADSLEHTARSRRDGYGAVATFPLAQTWVDDQNIGAAPQRLFQ